MPYLLTVGEFLDRPLLHETWDCDLTGRAILMKFWLSPSQINQGFPGHHLKINWNNSPMKYIQSKVCVSNFRSFHAILPEIWPFIQVCNFAIFSKLCFRSLLKENTRPPVMVTVIQLQPLRKVLLNFQCILSKLKYLCSLARQRAPKTNFFQILPQLWGSTVRYCLYVVSWRLFSDCVWGIFMDACCCFHNIHKSQVKVYNQNNNKSWFSPGTAVFNALESKDDIWWGHWNFNHTYLCLLSSSVPNFISSI